MNKRSQLVFFCVLIAVTFLAYWPALRGGFVWDDDAWTTGIAGLHQDASGLWAMWTQPTALQQYYPLAGSTFWLDYQCWKFWTTPYHIENVALHLVAVFLFWRLLVRLRLPGAWLAAGLFAMHPVMVESVGWITERKNVLSLVFYLAALLAYLRYAQNKEPLNPQRSTLNYFLSLFLFVGALLAKTTAFSLPAVILLLAWWQRGRLRWRADVVPTLPFFALSIGLCVVTAWLEKHHVGAQGSDFELSFPQRLLIAGRVPWFYLGQLLWPGELCFVYPRWQPETGVWWQWLYPAATVVTLLVLWLGRGRIGRGPLTAVLFFGGTLFPVLGFMNAYFMRFSFVCDHWVYLSSLGVITLVAAGGARLGERLRTPALVYGLAVIVLPVLAVLTWRQAGNYHDMETFWRTTLAGNPNAFVAYNNLGITLLKKGQTDEAMVCFQKSLTINPGFSEPHHNLAGALILKGRADEAIVHYQRALQIQPNNPVTQYFLGIALLQTGRWDEATNCFQKALQLKPDYAEADYNLGGILRSQGRLDQAAEYYQKAIQIKPDYAMAHYDLAVLLGRQNRWDEAAGHFRKTTELKPDFADAYLHYGTILGQSGQVRAAVVEYREALKLNPDLVGALNNLAWIFAASSEDELRNGAEAVRLAEHACELTRYQEPQFIGTLAAAYAEAGRFPEAVSTAEKAAQLADRDGLNDLATKNRQLLELYRVSKPAREPTPPKP